MYTAAVATIVAGTLQRLTLCHKFISFKGCQTHRIKYGQRFLLENALRCMIGERILSVLCIFCLILNAPG